MSYLSCKSLHNYNLQRVFLVSDLSNDQKRAFSNEKTDLKLSVIRKKFWGLLLKQIFNTKYNKKY